MKYVKIVKHSFVMLFFIVSFRVQSDSLSLENVYENLNEQAEKLNTLIARYQHDNDLEISEQESFAAELVNFKNNVEVLKMRGISVKSIEKNYVENYEAWAQEMIAEPSLINEIKDAGQPKTLDSKNVSHMILLYETLQSSIMQSQQQFQAKIQAKLNNLSTYSSFSQKSFLASLQNEFDAFCKEVQSAKTFTKNSYFTFLMNQSSSFSPSDLTENDKKFLQGIDKVVQSAIIFQRAFMLQLTSQNFKNKKFEHLQDALKNAHLADDETYEKNLKINEEGLQRSWWEELTGYGKDLLPDFSKEFKKELAVQTNKAIEHVGGKVAGEIGTGVIKPVAEAASAQIAKFGITVKTESLENFFKNLSPAARAVKAFIRTTNPVIAPDGEVVVKTDISLSDAEQQAVSNRMKKISTVLKNEFNINEPLRMAVCCSGGGVRAMVGTMGIFQAAARAKILHSCLYMAGLSGSTWMIAPWSYLYLQNKLKKDYSASLQQMVDNWKIVLNDSKMVKVGSKVHTPANLTGKQASNFSSQVALQLAYGMPVTAVDIYGAMVGNFALNLAGEDRLKVVWSSIKQSLKNGEIPLPLCSAVFDGVLPEDRLSKQEYEWCEFSPFETGGTKIGYIPLDYLGSSFVNNKLDTSAGQLRPAYPLSFILGVCGSAFAINLNDVINKVLPSMSFTVEDQKITLPIDTWVRSTLDESFDPKGKFKRGDSLYALFANYSVDSSKSVLYKQDMFELVDGGIAFNIPLPLLSDRPQRAVDLIIMYDSNPVDMGFFNDAAAYYKKDNAASMPDLLQVSEKVLKSQTMTVFNDPRDGKYDKEKPTLLYFPTMVDITKLPYITTNFKYASKDLEKLIDTTDAAFTSKLDDIKAIMKLVAKNRHA